jgi:hypothetical protein
VTFSYRQYTAFGDILHRKCHLSSDGRALELRDESLEDSGNLPEPGVIARDIIADLESALEQLRLIAEDVGEELAED